MANEVFLNSFRTSKNTSRNGSMRKSFSPLAWHGSSCKYVRLAPDASLIVLHSDLAYYGVNLNQSIILSRIGYGKAATPWGTLWNTAVGNVIVAAAVSQPI